MLQILAAEEEDYSGGVSAAVFRLNDDELAAVQDGVVACDQLLTKLVDLPTPAGPSLRQMNSDSLVQVATENGHDAQLRLNARPTEAMKGSRSSCLGFRAQATEKTKPRM